MSNAQTTKQSIDDFLTQKITNSIESKEKKAKKTLSDEEKQKILHQYETYHWLDFVSQNAENVFLNVSHVAKLTHSSSQAMSLRDMVIAHDNLHIISTQSVNSSHLDSGYSNAVLAPIAEFLSYPIKNSNEQLGELLAQDIECFGLISGDKEQCQLWHTQIKKAYQSASITSHTLAKQIYVPIDKSDYHLLSPMQSSSLAHEIYLSIKHHHDKNNPAKQAKKDNVWHDDSSVYYPNIATLGITKSNHQNVSKLNGERAGQLYLFSSLPPTYQKNSQPPINIEQLLSRCYQGWIFHEIEYLLDLFKQNQLFINHDRKQYLKGLIEELVGNVCDEMLIIRNQQPAEWSVEKNLPNYLSMFMDSAFLQNHDLSEPQSSAYLDELSAHIAKWISHHIKDKIRDKALEKLWVKFSLPILQELYWALKAEN